jgi:hypothetical protein
MATPPTFTTGAVLTAAQMNAVGLWLVKTQTVGSGVASVTVTGAFSADYDNYKITYDGGTGTTLISLSLKLGASTTGYYAITNYAAYNNNLVPLSGGDNNASLWNTVGYATTGHTEMCLDLLSPFLAKRTSLCNAAWCAETVAGSSNGLHQVSTSYTDFTIGVNTGTISGGTIRVYGYRN